MKATNVSALDLGALNLSPRTLAALQDPKTWQRNRPQQMPQKRIFSEVQSSMQQPSKPEFSTNSSAGDTCMHANYHLHSVKFDVQAVQKKLDAMGEFSLQAEETQTDQISRAIQSPRSIYGERNCFHRHARSLDRSHGRCPQKQGVSRDWHQRFACKRSNAKGCAVPPLSGWQI